MYGKVIITEIKSDYNICVVTHFYFAVAYDENTADNEIKPLSWMWAPLFPLWYKHSMDAVTPPLSPRLVLGFESDARNLLCESCLLLFVQIQNVPETVTHSITFQRLQTPDMS